MKSIITTLLLLNTLIVMAEPELSEDFGDKELIPLFKKALSSITENPIFYSYGSGYGLYTELSKKLKKHEKMQKFDYIPLYKTWDMLTHNQQEKFNTVAYTEKNNLKYYKQISKLNLSLAWKVSRSNRNINALCCGGACNVKIIVGKIKHQPRVTLSIYKTNSTYDCRLGYSISYDTWRKYKREQWNKFHFSGDVKDLNCDGNLAVLNFDNEKIEKEFRKLYKELFKLIDPVKTLQLSSKEQCDV